MLDQDNEVIKCLKACILSRKGGVPFNELNEDYRELVGADVPHHSLGFSSLGELLRSVAGVLVDQRAGVVRTTPTEQTQHLHQMIQKQKVSKKKIVRPYIPKNKFHKLADNKKPHRAYLQPQSHKNRHQQHHQKPQRGYHQPQRQERQHQQYHQKPQRVVHQPQPQKNHHQQYHQKPHFPTEPTYIRYWSNPYLYSSDCETHNDHYRYQIEYQNELYHMELQSYMYDLYDTQSYCSDEFSYSNEFSFSDRSSYATEYSYSSREQRSCKFRRGTISGYSVIGDDHMLELLGGAPTALCDSGMSLKRALLAVRKHGCSDRVLISLGTIDVLKGNTYLELILDMKELIQTVCNTGARVAVCTIPPVPGIRNRRSAIESVNEFNKWLVHGDHLAHDIVDLNSKFKNGRHVRYELFQQPPKMPMLPGCHWDLVSWNKTAQSLVEKELKYCLKTTI